MRPFAPRRFYPREAREPTPLPTAEQARWATFNAQEPAMREAAATNKPLWAQELDRHGRRRYIVAERVDFWRRYKRLRPSFRSFYEVIIEAQPCHAYLDLEYRVAANPHCDGARMVRTVREAFAALVERRLGVAVSDECFVELDSSTDAKFSRHVVLKLPGGAAFADNSHVGRLVRECVDELRVRRDAGDAAAAELWVAEERKQEVRRSADHADESAALSAAPADEASAVSSYAAGERSALFVDLSVYSRNRCFRLYKSTKVGKTAQLLPVELDADALAFLPAHEERRLFLRSLVTNVDADARLISFGQGDPANAAHQRERTASVCPRVVLPARGADPLARLTCYMLESWRRATGLPAVARTRCLDASRGQLKIDLSPTNRWCSHVRRQHRSNATFLVADLERCCFVQRCYDADCRAAGGVSNEFPFPRELLAGEPSEPSAAAAAAAAAAGGGTVPKERGASLECDDPDEAWWCVAERSVSFAEECLELFREPSS